MEPIPHPHNTSLVYQAYGSWSQYRLRDAHSGSETPASSAMLTVWSERLKSRATSEADRKNADLLASIAKGIAADPYGDSWVPLMRHFYTAGTQVPSNDLKTILRELGVVQELHPRYNPNEGEIDEDYADEDAFVASIPADELAKQVRGEPVLTDEQRKTMWGTK